MILFPQTGRIKIWCTIANAFLIFFLLLLEYFGHTPLMLPWNVFDIVDTLLNVLFLSILGQDSDSVSDSASAPAFTAAAFARLFPAPTARFRAV